MMPRVPRTLVWLLNFVFVVTLQIEAASNPQPSISVASLLLPFSTESHTITALITATGGCYTW